MLVATGHLRTLSLQWPPVSLRSRHLNGLDGLRALAVGAVVAYHLNLPWARGGFLGVDLFFVLSGFLITTLMLEERSESGRIDMVSFWRRRARRLLPALYLMLAVVCLWPLATNIVGIYNWSSINLATLRSYGISSVFYVTNWVVIATGRSYFTQFSTPSPLAHTWSLAIEEQFYLVWPLVTMGLLWRGVVGSRRWRGVFVCSALAVGSTALMVAIVHPYTPDAINYVYNSTFTRLFDLAVGAALAWWSVGREIGPRQARTLSVAGPLALVALLAAMGLAGDEIGNPLKWLFEGGFLVMAVVAAVVIAALRVEGSWTARLFSWSPLRLVGRTSYGIYLWHWPVFVMVTTLTVHLAGASLLLVRLGLVVALTAASYVLLEQPIRQRRWPVIVRRSLAVGGTFAVIAAVLVGTSPSAYSYPDARIMTARNAPAVVPDGSGSIDGAAGFTWGAMNPPTSTHPVSVVQIGDSLTAYAYPGMRAAVNSLAFVHIHNASGPGFGLSVTPNWRASLHLDIALFHPQIVLYTTTWDDPAALADPASYIGLLTEVGDYLKSHGVHGFFIEGYPLKHTSQAATLPPSAINYLNLLAKNRAAAWQSAVRHYVAANPGFAAFLPIDQSVLINGATAFWMAPPRHPHVARSTWDRVRFIDGSHLCTVGVVRFSAALAQDLVTLLHSSPPDRRWWLGSWVNHPFPNAYASELQGMCPLDHP